MRGFVPPDPDTDVSTLSYAVVYAPRNRRKRFPAACVTLMDDCEQFPLWRRKLEEDLGGVVSFMAIQMEEVASDDLNTMSPIFKRFQDDK